MSKRRSNQDTARQPSGASGVPGKEEAWWGLIQRALAYADDLGALLIGALALVILLGLTGLTQGKLVDFAAMFLRRWLGWGAFSIPVVLGLGAFLLVRKSMGHAVPNVWGDVVAVEVALFGLLGLLSVLDGMLLPRAEAGAGGGLVGWGLATLLTDLLTAVGRDIVLLAMMTIGTGYALRRALVRLIGWLATEQATRPARPVDRAHAPASQRVVQQPVGRAGRRLRSSRQLPRRFRKSFRIPDQPEEKVSAPIRRDHRLPPVEILAGGEWARVTAREVNLTAGLIEKTLADFGLPVRVVGFRTGPTVTQYAVEPGYTEQPGANGVKRRQKVKVSQISGLANDLALALSARRLRIEAPVPGHTYLGIEVPNRRPALVRLRPMLESTTFQSLDSPLAMTLGRDVAGSSVAADLTSMPHLLIAGTTGSGKTVGLTGIAACLIMNNTPEDLRLVMIDPKMVELVRFNGLPHLFGKVETELERIVGVLRWCTVEMDRRYKLLEEMKSRDIEAYNRAVRRRRSAERLPRIVVMVDELADLMMMAPDQTERTLVRLAQMARATGIHLVVATQRPSTEIVTGLIKANFPARISFAVASSVDSRVILDMPGAETLLGRGDMLYLSPEASVPARLQGVFVSDQEIERIVDYWRNAVREEGREEPEEAPWEDMLSRQMAMKDRDDILEQAIELVRAAGHASASMLQRGLKVGYPRAARLMDELEELGIIGRPQSGGRTREVLIEKDDDPLNPKDDAG